MKTKKLAGIFLAMSLAMCMFLFNACKKDNDEDKPGSYRMIESREYDDGILSSRSFYEYSGDKLVRVRSSGYSGFADSSLTELVYSGSTVTMTNSYFLDLWGEVSRIEMVLQGGLVTQEIYSFKNENTWQPLMKDDYLYNGSKLQQNITYFFGEGRWDPWMKAEYEYEGDRIEQLMYYEYYDDDWVVSMKFDYEYNGESPSKVTASYFSQGMYFESYRYLFEYSSNQLTRMDVYENMGSWVLGTTITWTYDAFGNVQSWNISDNNGSEKAEFLYGEGAGNARQILYHDMDFLDYYPVPAKSLEDKIKSINDIKPNRLKN